MTAPLALGAAFAWSLASSIRRPACGGPGTTPRRACSLTRSAHGVLARYLAFAAEVRGVCGAGFLRWHEWRVCKYCMLLQGWCTP